MTQPGEVRIQRAVLSVSDKTGIVDFARGLAELGVELVSTGGTADGLRRNGIQATPVRKVADGSRAEGEGTIADLLVAGDIDSLSPRFALIGTLADEGGWTLRLTPRPGPLARVFTTIDLAGDAHVREVRIVEAAGDRTTIRFDALVDAPPADAAELARFD